MNELARRMGISQPTLLRIEEKGDRTGVVMAVRVARALETTVEKLLGEATPPAVSALVESRFATVADLEALRAEWKAFRADFAAVAALEAEAHEADTPAVGASKRGPAKRSQRGSKGQKAS